LTRGSAGVAVGDGLALAVALGDADAGIRKLGSGSALGSGPARAVADGWAKISSAVSRATSVAYPAYAWGAMTARSMIAAIGMNSRRPGRGRLGSQRLAATARRRQTRNSNWRPSNPHRTAGSKSVAASRGRLLVATMRAPTSIATTTGMPKIAARRRRPAARWPRPGNSASRSAGT
jgi:hypothetical protein